MTAPTREQAFALLLQYNSNISLLNHARSVEATMRYMARKRGEDEDKWGVIGLVHDLLVPGMAQEITEYTPLAKHFPTDADLSSALEMVFGTDVDIVIFGHTHYPVVEEYQGILMVNPGSPSLPKQIRRLGQVAIMELTPEHKSAEILDLSSFS